MDLEVRPVTADDLDALAAVLSTSGDAPNCWCQWFHLGTAGWRETGREVRRDALAAQVTCGPRPPGVLAVADGEPAGWCAVAPRASYARLRASRKLRAAGVPLDDADAAAERDAPRSGPVGGVWAVTCFVVRPPYRRRGLTARMLDGAVALARDGGADVVEGYPVDLSYRDKIVNQELYVGTLPTFLAAGFDVVGRSAPARPVVRLALRADRARADRPGRGKKVPGTAGRA